jgi:hypothetical protein
MNRRNPLLRCALLLQQRLERCQNVPLRNRQYLLAGVAEQATAVLVRLDTCRIARQRNWHHAVQVTESAAVNALYQLQHTLNSALLHHQARLVSSVPRLRDLCEELEQLDLEFGGVVLDVRHRLISVTTDPIELEDIHLGAFRIELHLERLGDHPGVSAFDIVALQPNPPDISDDVTHPHVKDRLLCAGDGTMPIARALQQGHLTDAFLTIRSILETYNASSPYVALEDWHGRPCSDCGTSVDPDNASTCEQCSEICCEDCASWCDICESSFCRSCLEEDIESGRLCCRSCRHRCETCNRIVDADSWVEETGLCPGCHEEHLQEQENDHDESDNDGHAEPPDSDGPAQPAQEPMVASQAS